MVGQRPDSAPGVRTWHLVTLDGTRRGDQATCEKAETPVLAGGSALIDRKRHRLSQTVPSGVGANRNRILSDDVLRFTIKGEVLARNSLDEHTPEDSSASNPGHLIFLEPYPFHTHSIA